MFDPDYRNRRHRKQKSKKEEGFWRNARKKTPPKNTALLNRQILQLPDRR